MKKILTFGVYDYFHLGHLRLFKQCKQYGDYLIVAVQESEYVYRFKRDYKMLYSTAERVEMIEALRIVDEVKTYDFLGVSTIEKFDFDILALGEDHKGDRFDEIAEWSVSHGKEVVRLKRTSGISSTSIKKGL